MECIAKKKDSVCFLDCILSLIRFCVRNVPCSIWTFFFLSVRKQVLFSTLFVAYIVSMYSILLKEKQYLILDTLLFVYSSVHGNMNLL